MGRSCGLRVRKKPGPTLQPGFQTPSIASAFSPRPGEHSRCPVPFLLSPFFPLFPFPSPPSLLLHTALLGYLLTFPIHTQRIKEAKMLEVRKTEVRTRQAKRILTAARVDHDCKYPERGGRRQGWKTEKRFQTQEEPVLPRPSLQHKS